ncbi:PaaI family thioesterase [Salinactinospora qingdaonensis]|uniref:Acyl-coenzyme A thioesterase THEM4 n=1 Tax=Salinactinospora qingdaonensis TaxID=702744 RepID=A0ABP7FQ05_9ACTN
MTVQTQPDAALPDPADFGFSVIAEDDLPPELLALAEQVRHLVEAVAHTDVEREELVAARGMVEALTERLNARRRDTTTVLKEESPQARAEYSTVINAVSGDTNPAAPPLSLERTDDGLRGEVTLSGAYQGPPGAAHGGWVAALLDQALGAAAGAAGMPGLTANLNVDFHEITPLNEPLSVEARVTGTERRKVFVSGEIRHNGQVTATGTAIMVRLAL